MNVSREGRLIDRAAIITGAASGIGAASARLFAEEGAKVLAVDVNGAGLTGLGSGIEPLQADLADAGAAERIVVYAIERFGHLDILFNNAGIATNALAHLASDEDFDRTLEINLKAAFRLCRAATPHLIASSAGRIINTASVMAQGTDYGLAAYCASKAGIVGLTRTLALELGKHAITANAILPGAIRTGMTAGMWDARPDIAETWAKKAALRRLGQPLDIARAALFLASDDGGFVTGHELLVDGGLTLRV
jgi:NAD(P)-dependent dehydrogenase (short-subunit alcohol dehydrogenase family)